MLAERIKTQMLAALKAGRSLEKEILRVALGEIQTVEARKGSLTDEESQAIVKKLVKSNRETLEAATDPAQKKTLGEEIAILEALLPQKLDEAGLRAALAPELERIRAAANDGQATGIAMKALKTQGAEVDGKLVGEIVKKLRA
ncbi:MAG TPA: GatB/YqeY domain-containing protein [Polyangiaceae bacterium]|nr:GatB/YqeY domain-containing protein [Polyangiaceae bacterium]